MNNQRKDKIRELLNREVAMILPRHIRAETYNLLSITHVDLNKDLSIATIYIVARENMPLLQKELDFKVRDIQNEVNKNLYMKVVPKLVLRADEKATDFIRIEKLIDNL